jgi:hypothetical protein
MLDRKIAVHVYVHDHVHVNVYVNVDVLVNVIVDVDGFYQNPRLFGQTPSASRRCVYPVPASNPVPA